MMLESAAVLLRAADNAGMPQRPPPMIEGRRPEPDDQDKDGVWFRVFRTMTRDAMVALDLPRDPTLRVSLPELPLDCAEPNSLTPEQLVTFLEAMRNHYPQHYALVATLAYTGLRFCHASALRWEDWDEPTGVLRVARKHFRGGIGPVSRKKQAPKEYPVEPELAQILGAHRERLLQTNAEGLAEGWMFPSAEGTLRTPNSLDRAWAKCLKHAEITKRFTVHGLRYTFTDLVRRANVDAVVRRALTGHVTEQMQRHYSPSAWTRSGRRSPGCCGWCPRGTARQVGVEVGTPRSHLRS